MIQMEEQLMCPITIELMREPVITAQGITFERAALIEWLVRSHGVCPVTREHVDILHVRPNRVVKDLTDKLLAQKRAEQQNQGN